MSLLQRKVAEHAAKRGKVIIPVRMISSSTLNTSNLNTKMNATVFGANGEIGNAVAYHLAAQKLRLIVPYRDDGMNIRPVKLTGLPGMVAPTHYSMFDEKSMAKTMEGSDIVVNCIGAKNPTVHYNLYEANVNTALRIAKIAKEVGVKRMVHVSAAGAYENSTSEFLRCKAESEEAVKAYFPDASIIRPCFTFTVNNALIHDMFSNVRFGMFKYIKNADAYVQPTYASDVGKAIAQIAMNPVIDGQTWTLGGEKIYTRFDLYQLFNQMVNVESSSITSINKDDSKMLTNLCTQFGVPIGPFANKHTNDYEATDITLDHVIQGTKGFAELGITPTPTELAFLKIARAFMRHNAAALYNPTVSKWTYKSDI